jgi:hypothetical protein
MSLAKVTKQLKREFKANPTKAGALGVSCIVAAVFWGPLLFKSDEKPKKPAASASAAAPTAGDTAVAAKALPTLDWRMLAKGLAADPRTKAALPGPRGNTDGNPFRAKTAEEENEEWFALLDELNGVNEEKPPVVATPEPLDFARYPLELTSTVVGSRVRTAVINGKTRKVGGEIEQWNGGPVVLAEVEPRFAVVVWKGKQRKLSIPNPAERPVPPPAAAPASSDEGLPNTPETEVRDGDGVGVMPRAEPRAER